MDEDGHREARPDAGPAGARRDREDLGSQRPLAVPRIAAAGRRRRPEQHALPHRPALRALGGSGVRASRPLRRLLLPGRPRHARPRLLPQERREVPGAPGEVPDARRGGPRPGEDRGRRRRRPSGSTRSRRRSRTSTSAAPTRSTSTRPTTPGRRRSSRPARPASTGRRTSAPPGLAEQPVDHGLAPVGRRRHRGPRRPGAARPSGRSTSPSGRSIAPRRSCRARSRKSTSVSTTPR